MTHYFLISANGPDEGIWDADMLDQKNGLSWMDFIKGARLVKEQVQEPIIIELDYLEYTKPEWFELPLMFNEELIKDLLDFGIDNLDLYDAEMVDPETGKIWTEYKICNIIGKVDVFDMDKSELHPDSPPKVAYLFNEIVIDDEKAKGHHIFRPYGRSSEIMVSEELKNYLEAKGKYPHMKFIHPSKFG